MRPARVPRAGARREGALARCGPSSPQDRAFRFAESRLLPGLFPWGCFREPSVWRSLTTELISKRLVPIDTKIALRSRGTPVSPRRPDSRDAATTDNLEINHAPTPSTVGPTRLL